MEHIAATIQCTQGVSKVVLDVHIFTMLHRMKAIIDAMR